VIFWVIGIFGSEIGERLSIPGVEHLVPIVGQPDCADKLQDDSRQELWAACSYCPENAQQRMTPDASV
jgi:hypothetical protein